jgi:hypothetical protein
MKRKVRRISNLVGLFKARKVVVSLAMPLITPDDKIPTAASRMWAFG